MSRSANHGLCKDLIYAETMGFVARLSDDPKIEGTLETYKLEPFNIDWSWKQLIPKLIRLSVLAIIIVGVWSGVPKLADVLQNIRETHQEVKKTGETVEELKGWLTERLLSTSPASAAPGVGKAVGAAVQTAVDGAAAGDQRYAEALNLLKQGKATEAEQLFRAVAEEKAARIKTDSSTAAAAFRNLGAIAGLSEPKRAQEAYSRALSFDPDDMEALYWFGWLNQRAGKLTIAEQSLNWLLRVASAAEDQRGVYRAHLRLGEINAERGNLTLAREPQKQAIAIAVKQAGANAKTLSGSAICRPRIKASATCSGLRAICPRRWRTTRPPSTSGTALPRPILKMPPGSAICRSRMQKLASCSGIRAICPRRRRATRPSSTSQTALPRPILKISLGGTCRPRIKASATCSGLRAICPRRWRATRPPSTSQTALPRPILKMPPGSTICRSRMKESASAAGSGQSARGDGELQGLLRHPGPPCQGRS